jgi:ATP-dependent helicase HrpA
MGRMVLEADRLGCADEVIVVAAALSIQDPRERPADKQAQADQAHARFRDEDSDFIGLLNLWRYLREQQRELSGSAFRRLCKAEFVNYLRVREWQDLVSQLRQASKGVGVTINREPAEAQSVHVALLSALLSHVGLKDSRGREYQGARGARFALFPGSGLARRPPEWVMVAELMETSRLWGLTAARIDPGWIEPLAVHLVNRSYSEPRWSRSRASVVATERVTLYGLPIVTGRTVAYGRIDPVLSRELFIRQGLVEGEWDARHDFLEENRRRVAEVEALEDRARRRDLLAGDAAIFAFYDERIPGDVVSGAHFDRWWRDARRADPDRLTIPRDRLLDPAAADAVDAAGRPDTWKQGEHRLRLTYAFEPGSEHDGVTVHVPLALLGQIRPAGFDWLVPAFRPELVTALIRSLPKELRRPLVPVPETAEQVVAALRPRKGALVDAVAAAIEALRGVRVPPGAFDIARLPSHLRMRFAVEDAEGQVIAEGDDLDAVRAQLRPRLRAELASASAGLERSGLRAWDLDTLPRVVALPGTGQAVRAYPALVDEGDSVAVRVLDTPSAQAATMWAGTRRLLLLSTPSPLRHVQGRLGNAAQLALAGAPHGGPRAVLEDAIVAAADDLMTEAGGPAWDAAGFARLRDHVAGHLAERTAAVVDQVVAILDAARDVQARLEPLRAVALQPARADVERQLARLIYPGFVAGSGVDRLPDIERYLRAASRRLERLPDAPAPDRDHMNSIHELEEAYRRRLEARPKGRPLPTELREVKWMLEELRVSHFAQHLGTRGPVSAKRIRAVLAGR